MVLVRHLSNLDLKRIGGRKHLFFPIKEKKLSLKFVYLSLIPLALCLSALNVHEIDFINRKHVT